MFKNHDLFKLSILGVFWAPFWHQMTTFWALFEQKKIPQTAKNLKHAKCDFEHPYNENACFWGSKGTETAPKSLPKTVENYMFALFTFSTEKCRTCVQNNSKMSPKVYQNLSKNKTVSPYCPQEIPRAPQGCPRAPQGLHFGAFWCPRGTPKGSILE